MEDVAILHFLENNFKKYKYMIRTLGNEGDPDYETPMFNN